MNLFSIIGFIVLIFFAILFTTQFIKKRKLLSGLTALAWWYWTGYMLWKALSSS